MNEEQIKKNYDKSFYGDGDKRKQNAVIVLENVFEITGKPNSLIDVGCGLGHWLNVARSEFKINDILGVDGNYVQENDFLIPWKNFKRHNLENELVMDRKFDLCMSIETGEHLPPEKATTFVKSLTALSDTVLFSAAAPFQKGVNHLNENTPTYWAQKFALEGFVCFDVIRNVLWNIEGINCIYPQNMLLFVKRDKASSYEKQGYIANPTPDLKYHPGYVTKRLITKGKGLKGLIRKWVY